MEGEREEGEGEEGGAKGKDDPRTPLSMRNLTSHVVLLTAAPAGPGHGPRRADHARGLRPHPAVHFYTSAAQCR